MIRDVEMQSAVLSMSSALTPSNQSGALQSQQGKQLRAV